MEHTSPGKIPTRCGLFGRADLADGQRYNRPLRIAAVGLGGFVTPKGWVELANPASSRMSIRLFNINNCSAKASTLKTDGGDATLSEFTEIGEFKLALRTLRSAVSVVMPWNQSYSALENFLVSTSSAKKI